MKKRILSFLLTFCLVFSLVSTAALAAVASNFKDVGKNSWYYEYVDFVTTKGYFNGTSATTFEPNTTMTRAMFVTVLARLDGAEVDDSQSSFADVPAGSWYAGATRWAEDNQIVTGIGDNLFDPEDEITREQMCVIIDRFVDYYSEKTGQTHVTDGSGEAFPDAAQISDYAKEAVENCRLYGLVEGYTDGNFHPTDDSTRAQVAAVIYRLDWLVKGTYTLTYNANGGAFSDKQTTFVDTISAVGTTCTFTITTQVPTRSGYTFQGWSEDKDATKASYTKGDAYQLDSANPEKTLYAVWAANGGGSSSTTYSLTLYANGGSFDSGNTLTVSQRNNSKFSLTDIQFTAVPDGKQLLGWSTENGATASYKDTYTVSSVKDDTLYAIWTDESNYIVDLTYDANNGKINEQDSLRVILGVAAGDPVTLIDTVPVRDKNQFVGWSITSNATVANYKPGDTYITSVTEDVPPITFYAVWLQLRYNEDGTELLPNSYTLTYDANNGTFGDGKDTWTEYACSYEDSRDATVTEQAPNRLGYTFKGWAEAADATVEEYVAGDTYTLTGDATLYAVWVKDETPPEEVTYTLTYDANGGAFADGTATKEDSYGPTTDTTHKFVIDDSVEPTLAGYKFKGWSETQYQAGDDITNAVYVTSPVELTKDKLAKTLHAVWEKVTEYEYYVEVYLETPEGALPENFSPSLTSLVGADKAFDEVAKELVGDVNGNKTALVGDIQTALNYAVKRGEISRPYKGETITVSIDENFVISATTTMKVTHIIGDVSSGETTTDTETAALLAADDINVADILAGVEFDQSVLESLLTKLEEAASEEGAETRPVDLTIQEAAALDKVLAKAAEVPDMTEEEILAKIDQYVGDSAALNQAVAGLTTEEIKTAVGTYAGQLKDVQESAHAAIAGAIDAGEIEVDEAGNITSDVTETTISASAPAAPVVVTVKVNLGEYLKNAQTRFEKETLPVRVQNALTRVETKLQLTDDEKTTVENALWALYRVDAPEKFVENNGDGTLTLLSAEGYYALLVENVNAACDLWNVLADEDIGADVNFYADAIAWVENRVNGRSVNGVEYFLNTFQEDGQEVEIYALAKILGESTGFMEALTKDLVIPEGEDKAGYEVLRVTVTAEEAYPDLVDLVTARLANAGRNGIAELLKEILPQDIPDRMKGEYVLTVTIYKQVVEPDEEQP